MSTTTTLTSTGNGAATAAGPGTSIARPYRDFLTPCLHRQFTNAAFVGFCICYAAAVLMSPMSPFWWWFPIGPTGIRACLLFISVLCVFILRIANLRVASRQASSSASEYWKCIVSRGSYKTLCWYLVSAVVFSETYINSASPNRDLHILDNSRPYERTHLNERPIVLRTLFLLLAVWQSGYHIWQDLDQVRAPSSKAGPAALRHAPDAISEIRAQSNRIIQHAARSVMLTPVPAFLTYTLLLRRTIWEWTFLFAKSIFSNLPKHQKPSTFPPFLGDLILIYVGWGAVLVIIWGFSNVAFNVYLSQPPLDKKRQPLSSGSKDANGTLLNGLQSKREFVNNAAFAELAQIAYNDPTRRQTIFRELERTGGSTWAQLVTVCLGQLHGVSKRINDFTNPIPQAQVPVSERSVGTVNHLPRMAPPLRNDNIQASLPPSKHPNVQAMSSLAKSAGSHPGAQDSLSPRAQNYLHSTLDRFVSPEQQQVFSESGVVRLFQRYFLEFVQLPYVGPPFRKTYARRINAVVISQPERGGSSLSLLRNCVAALGQLAICAATEDSYGKASKDVASIIRTYSATIGSMEDFKSTLELHWTDVEFRGNAVPDVDELLQTLKSNQKSILETYEGYSELGLSYKEKRIAREKAGLSGVNADPFFNVARNDERIEMRERRRRDNAV